MIDLLNPDIEELADKWMPTVQKSEHIFTWTSFAELCWLAEYAKTRQRILEIGSHSGRSAKVMLNANPELRLVSLDRWDDPGSFQSYEKHLAPEINEGRVTFIKGSSQETIRQVVPYFSGCFIDGGHETHLVMSDIKNVLPLMADKSLMAGHDYRRENGNFNDVATAVNLSLPETKNPVESIWAFQT